MPGGEVGTAFIRIRPNTAGFKSETEAGIRGALSPIGKVAAFFGAAWGVTAGAHFVAGVASHAADMQKQGEALTQEFGQIGSERIKKFGETTATALGISAHQAEKTANMFGLIFQGMGIGNEKATEMAINLEKVAGGISQIKNVDPEALFAALPRILAGNLRGLRALGIAINAHAIQVRAMAQNKDLLPGEPLTTAQKALAVYSLVMDRFDKIQSQALSHQSDLANILRRVKAEFDNQKDALGKGLLPQLVQLGHVLEAALPGVFATLRVSLKIVTDGISGFYKIVGAIDPLGKAKTAIEALTAAFIVKRILDWVGGFRQVPTAAEKAAVSMAKSAEQMTAAVKGMQTQTDVAATEVTKDFEQMAVAAKTSSAEIVSALSITDAALPGEGMRTLTASQARSGRIAQMQTGGTLAGGAQQLRSQATGRFAAVRPAMFSGEQGVFAQGEKNIANYKKSLLGIPAAAKTAAHGVASAFSPLASVARSTASTASRAFTSFFTGLKTLALTTAAGIRAALIQAIPILLITVAIQLIIEHFSTLKRWFFDFLEAMKNGWRDLGSILIGAAKVWAGSIATILLGSLRLFLEGLNAVAGLLSKVGIHIGGGVKSALEGLKSITTGLVTSGAEEVKKAGSRLADDFTTAFSNDAKDKGKKAGEDAGDAIVSGLQENLGKNNRSLNLLREQIAQLLQGPSEAGINKAKQNLRNLGQELSDAITKQTNDVRDAVNAAKQNLQGLSNTLSSAIGQMIDAPLQAEQAALQRAADRRSLEQLREEVFLPGGKQLAKDPKKALQQLKELAAGAGAINRNAILNFRQQYQAQLLQVQQDEAEQRKQAITKRLNDEAYAFAQGKISYKKFRQEVGETLKGTEGVAKIAGKLLGGAFIGSFHQETKDFFAQAVKIAKGPHVEGTSAFATTITDPLKVMRDDQKDIKKIQQRIRNGQVALTAAINKHAHQAKVDREKAYKLQQEERALLKDIATVQEQLSRARAKRAQDKNPAKQSAKTVALERTGG